MIWQCIVGGIVGTLIGAFIGKALANWSIKRAVRKKHERMEHYKKRK